MQAEFPVSIGALPDPSCGASRLLSNGDNVDEHPACQSGAMTRVGRSPTKRRRRGRFEARPSGDLPKSPCARATNSALGRPKALYLSQICL